MMDHSATYDSPEEGAPPATWTLRLWRNVRRTPKLAQALSPAVVVVVAAFGLLSGCFSYRSVSGKIYGPGVGGLEAAVRESASVNLHCPSSEVGKLRVVTSAGRHHHSSLYVADGCGQRAVYAADCSSPCTRACEGRAHVGFEAEPCRPQAHAGSSDCEMVLISKVPLD